jgi:hypothetical protein
VTRPDKTRPTTTIAPQNPAAQERFRDNEHLRLLSICHFVVGGFAALMLPFLGVHFLFAYSMFTLMPFIAGPNQNVPPPEIFQALFWIYPIVGLFCTTGAALNLLCGWFLLQKTHRIFSFVVAWLDCLWLPWGTVLGVFTILVLTRPSVQRMYETGPHP